MLESVGEEPIAIITSNFIEFYHQCSRVFSCLAFNLNDKVVISCAVWTKCLLSTTIDLGLFQISSQFNWPERRDVIFYLQRSNKAGWKVINES